MTEPTRTHRAQAARALGYGDSVVDEYAEHGTLPGWMAQPGRSAVQAVANVLADAEQAGYERGVRAAQAALDEHARAFRADITSTEAVSAQESLGTRDYARGHADGLDCAAAYFSDIGLIPRDP